MSRLGSARSRDLQAKIEPAACLLIKFVPRAAQISEMLLQWQQLSDLFSISVVFNPICPQSKFRVDRALLMSSSSPVNSKGIATLIRFRPWAWSWPMVWLAFIAASGALGGAALIRLVRIPPMPDCEQISRFSADSERFFCARLLVESGNPEALASGLELIAPWSEGHPLYSEAHPLVELWSKALLKQAQQRVEQGKLAEAVNLVNRIPRTSPVFDEAQQTISQWEAEWKKGDAIQSKVQTAIAEKDWEVANVNLQALKSLTSDYWLSTRYHELQQRLDVEKTAWDQISQARALAKTADPDKLGEAITLAESVSLQSEVWHEARQDIDEWSHTLLNFSFRQWELGNVDVAIAAVQKIPPDPSLAPEAKDLVQFGHARLLANQSKYWKPSYQQVFALMEAIHAAEQIPADSPFYEIAHSESQSWRAQLQDLAQLQFAAQVAQLDQIAAYRYAMGQAALIESGRPRRIQAQTLIADWQQAIERIEDRPYLQQADTLASQGTIASLQAAIEQASQVKLGRALRLEAQTRIADWQAKIQILQDQPILNQANTLASSGKLKDAIAEAKKIEPGRALYDQAQTAIRDWTTQIQIAEDGPILAKARELAAQGSLTEAINMASQIGSGRALSREADNAIAIWEDERDYIWSTWEAEEPEAVAEPVPEEEPIE